MRACVCVCVCVCIDIYHDVCEPVTKKLYKYNLCKIVFVQSILE